MSNGNKLILLTKPNDKVSDVVQKVKKKLLATSNEIVSDNSSNNTNFSIKIMMKL